MTARWTGTLNPARRGAYTASSPPVTISTVTETTITSSQRFSMGSGAFSCGRLSLSRDHLPRLEDR